MEKTKYKFNRFLLPCLAAVFVLMLACEKEDTVSAPVITEVRNYEASPNDTLVNTINTGQWVVIMGKNLSHVSEVYFADTPATINNTLFTDASIVVQIPSIAFQYVPDEKLNEITVISEGGSAHYMISIMGEPVISRVRNYEDAPNDTIVDAVGPGQHINIIGYNLKDASEIAFQGVSADLGNIMYTDSSAVVKVPEDLSGGDASLANTITYTTSLGTDMYTIKILGPPVILRISNENPNAGDMVYIYGNNLSPVQSLSFAGTEISEFTGSEDGESVGFIVPELSQSGPVEIVTLGGTFTTAFNVNDLTTGIIANFEWGDDFGWKWWGGAELKSDDPDFPGNSSQYLVLKTAILDPGAGDDQSTAIRIEEAPWLPVENISDPVNSWALKFEISIPEPWNGGTLSIKTSNNNYMARYEPWQVSSTNTAAHSTEGWQTVTIPLSAFRRNDATGDGKGEPVASINELFGGTGTTTSNLFLYMHNYGSSPTRTGFNAAFDNFRVVRR
ncbi:glycan-binding surface protein [Sinomicrobium kalidii]|uniref:glycan-binding surface protein n=1 Tax=Sinomicrobium kalidii TaxID=2900738 RepID=UPI001E56AB03|nr:glycan-binding surface protein [Sinomicrobium kalidii]UGU17671.1 glycan-binding surface protein [Sinomicrobium kalidii]